jgi:uncharacterized glyoxalase superfamily protein PhnB
VSGTRALSLTPHLFVRDAAAAIAFYTAVLGGHELLRQTLPDGSLLFSELAVGEARLLLSEETPGLGALAPATIGGSPVLLTLAVADPDRVMALAVEHGAQVEMPLFDSFWGARYGVLRDPFGHRWALTTEREELSPDELAERLRDYGTP